MARQTNNAKARRVQVEVDTSRPGVGVYQNIGGIARPSSSAIAAQGLAQALGLAADISNQVGQENRRADLQAGQIDAQTGAIDQARLDESEAYKTGALSIKSQADFIEYKRDLEEAYETQFDKSGSLDDLNNFINDFYASHYDGLNDPVVAQAVLPMMGETRAKLLAAHAEFQQKEVHAEVLNSFSSVAYDELKETGTINVQALHDQMMPVVGGSQANAMIASIVTQAAVEQGKPELLDLVPEKWADGTPGIGSIPSYKQKLAQARGQAEEAKLAKQSMTRVATLTDASALADRGQFNDSHAQTLLDIGVAEGTVASLWTRSQKAQYAAQTEGVRTSYILQGAGHLLSKDEAQNALDKIHANAEQYGLSDQDVIKVSAANSILPTAHKRKLEAASPMANPEAFDSAARLYAQYDAQDRNFAATQIPKEKVALFNRYLFLVDHGEMSSEQAMKHLNAIDPTVGEEIMTGKSGAQLRESYGDVFDRFGWWNDVQDTPLARRQIDEMAKMLYGYGFSAKESIEKSLEWYEDRYVVVDGASFRRELVPQDHEEMLEWFKEQKLGDEADEWKVRQDFSTDRQGSFVLVSVGENPLFAKPNQHYTWDEVNRLWEEEKQRRAVTAAEEKAAETRKKVTREAENRVRARLRGGSILGMSMDPRATAFDPLTRLSKEERERMVNEEIQVINDERALEQKKREELNEKRLRARAITELSGGSSVSGLAPGNMNQFLEWTRTPEAEKQRLIEERMEQIRRAESDRKKSLLERLGGY